MYNRQKDSFQKLEKELKKGYSNGVNVQYEKMNIEDLLRTSTLFRPPMNIYAISNCSKLTLNLKSSLLSNSNSFAEKQVLKEWEEESKEQREHQMLLKAQENVLEP
mmetsp:Transcript_43490/g.41955  ORF Transcript_43490/g.41955 Transcript_43490/m.41955 type:complete len:106 (+) Transcript_43490:736-1053(+)